MTVDDARKFLKGSRKGVKLDALEVVSLSEKELFVIQLRYITGLTQEKAADRLPLLYAKILSLSGEDAKREYSISPNGLQKEEQSKGKEPPAGMMKVYEFQHKREMDAVTRVKFMLDEYKR